LLDNLSKWNYMRKKGAVAGAGRKRRGRLHIG
jgi:hypothetical protein